MKKGIVLDRWAKGLSVMLEKIYGCSLITKLRSILLMEADFNATNKRIFGIEMMENARKYKLIPEEIFSERNRLAEDGTLSKVLFYDTVRQLRRPAGLASMDADNCYDRIAHPMASMIFQAFGVPTPAILSMLSTIQNMAFYLRTGYGDSTNFAGGYTDNSTESIKFQGMCQGNGASPAAWAVTTIPMISAHKKKGHGAHFISPITKLIIHLIGGLFVDDTDLMHLNMRILENIISAHSNLQEAVINWGRLLIATGGALKPEKCSYYLISFDWKKDGTWKYNSCVDDEEMTILVPMADGSYEPIEQLPLTTAIKTLGSMTCPTGSNTSSFLRMQEQGQGWIDRVINGKVGRRSVWHMLDCQFWPRVGYAIGNNTGSLKELGNCLQRIYWQILPRGGIRRSAPTGIRQLSKGFFGAGCPNPGVECLISQVTKLLIHYGCRSGIGIQLQVSLELMIIELGISSQPFQESFQKYESWITHSWIKSVWEKVDHYKLRLQLKPLNIEPPRTRDKWFMKAVIDLGCLNKHEMERINRVRIHQQVLFLSDILDAGGKCLDRKYLTKREQEEQWSTYIFPLENPPTRDFTLWREVINTIAPRGRRSDSLGLHIREGHKIWAWRLDTHNNRLYHKKGDTMDMYGPSTTHELARRPNTWSLTEENIINREVGDYCSVNVTQRFVNILSHTRPFLEPSLPSDFWEVILRWGNTWIWESLHIVGGPSWLTESIEANDCIAVTDGSYMKEVYPMINSAAFVFECTNGRGRIVGSFVERSPDAGSYRGELLGLMAIHLILKGVNEYKPNIQGSIHILSDCLGALRKVENLPPYRIPTRCSHSDILKNIMISCSDMTLKRIFSHVKAHQDDGELYDNLPRESQLNCQMDYHAKRAIFESPEHLHTTTKAFPLEPITIFMDKNKLTSDKGDKLRFWAHKQIAKTYFYEAKILFEEFDLIDWESIYAALHSVPRLFQIWACKQVMGIAPANGNRRWDTSLDPRCPSCQQERETCSHILHCNHTGRVDTLMKSIDIMNRWMKDVDTDPTLRHCITQYAKGRGTTTMSNICSGEGQLYERMAVSQDSIGWRRFMEGMICIEMQSLQETHTKLRGRNTSSSLWGPGLVTRLLEITHGQWLYRCVQIHDKTQGTLITNHKENLQRQIEEEMDKGWDDLLEEDQYLAEINLEDLEVSNGEQQEYWLLSIRAARAASKHTRRNQHRQQTTRTDTVEGHIFSG